MAQLKASDVFPYENPTLVKFPSRRSVVHSTKGMVACTQPLAAEAGQRILNMGGNAAVCRDNRTVDSLTQKLTEYQGRCSCGRLVLTATSCPIDLLNSLILAA